MKLRESGMPEEFYWETLFDVDLVLERLGINSQVRDVVELGCGYGTFTVPVAKRITGNITTIDIDLEMAERTRRRAAAAGLTNAVCDVRDVFTEGFGVSEESQDGCLLFNILHCEDPVRLLTLAGRSVRRGGYVYVLHWRHDPRTPRGPSMDIRPRPEQIIAWARETGFLQLEGGILDLPPWHYGLRLTRICSPLSD